MIAIVNPAAGHGRAGARWARARDAAGVREERATERAGHARELAREATEAGVELVVAVGGDGTLGEVVDGYLSVPEAARRATSLAVFPAGSGNDFARHAGVPGEPEAWAAALAAGGRRHLDAARATFRGPDGAPRARHFLNFAGAALAGEVARATAARGKALGGTLSYLLESARAVLAARPSRLGLVVDGAVEPPADYALVAVANTSTVGGGMRLAPDADAEDGLLDLLTVDARGRAELLGLLSRAYSGGHLGRPGVRLRRARRVELRGEGDLPLNIDGDGEGTCPAVFEVLPRALAFRL